MQVDVVLASFTQCTSRQFNFCFSYFYASCSNRISDVLSTNRTEQFAFITSWCSNSYFAQLSNFVGTRLSSSQLFSDFRFQLCATRFKFFNVCFGS